MSMDAHYGNNDTIMQKFNKVETYLRRHLQL